VLVPMARLRWAAILQLEILLIQRRSTTVRMKLNYIAALLTAGAAAVAIAAAPIAAAAPTTGQSCGASGTGTICQSPGNVQINDSPPPVQFYPYGGEALLL
jgi:hypothetical protein